MATTRPALAALLTEALMTFSSSSRPVNAAASGGFGQGLANFDRDPNRPIMQHPRYLHTVRGVGIKLSPPA